MIQQRDYYDFGAGDFTPNGVGWNWNVNLIESKLKAIPSKQKEFLEEHFISIDWLALAIYCYPNQVEGFGQFNFQYCSESQKKPTSDPLTIRCVQNLQCTASNIIYNQEGQCVIQVDFAKHGTALSGHWHKLVPGNLDHNEDHYCWSTCPVIFQCIPKLINGTQIKPPQTQVGAG
ncbi:MAG: hypothetical protein ACRCU2_15895 [Planktothrix sp.]